MGDDRTDQENFWALEYSKGYIRKNSDFDRELLLQGWREMLKCVEGLGSYIECGANVGRNIDALSALFPDSLGSAIEISEDAAQILRDKHPGLTVINNSILEADIPHKVDLSFTQGVLIHINPDELLQNVEKLVSLSNRYVLVGEYFNREPTAIPYQGHEDKLFKRDWGKFVLEHFGKELRLLDYGFLWGHIYDSGGFDDITWFLFERK